MGRKANAAELIPLHLMDPALYQLRIQGDLNEDWSDYFNAVCLTSASSAKASAPHTLICGVLDQAQLLGVLYTLLNWGIVLVKLEWIDVSKLPQKKAGAFRNKPAKQHKHLQRRG